MRNQLTGIDRLELNDYPRATLAVSAEQRAHLQQELLHNSQQIRRERESVAFCSNAIARATLAVSAEQRAFDANLKNDTQRKTKRAELCEKDADFIKASNELKRLEDLRGELEIDLQLLQATFSLLKLERREAIARMEATTIAA
jgi:hypothetical protein